MAESRDSWAGLAWKLKAGNDTCLIAACRRTCSVSFETAEHRLAAVEDARGVESLILGVMGQASKPAAASTKNSDQLSLRIAASPDAIAEFCDRWKVAELSLFGSVLRDDFVRESDIDVLVEFEPGGVPGIEFVSMASELSRLLGRSVDVVTRPAVERSPNYMRRKEILDSAQVIYTAR